MKRPRKSDQRDSALQIMTAESERRRFRRYSRAGWITIFPCSAEGAGSPLRVRFRDTCARGIGLSHSDSMPIGQQFLVGLMQPREHLVVVLFRVANCTGPHFDAAIGESVYHIGAEPCWVLRNQKIVEGNRLSPSAVRRIHQMIQIEACRGTANEAEGE